MSSGQEGDVGDPASGSKPDLTASTMSSGPKGDVGISALGPESESTASNPRSVATEDAVEKLTDLTSSDLLKLKEEAAEGSVPHQLQLARYYLNLSELGHDPMENGRMAVNWLMQASKQANQEATELLRDCVEKGVGVSDDNIDDVQWCIETPDIEKMARVAAKSLFHTLNPLKTSRMKKELYLEQVQALSADRVEANLLKQAGKKLDPDEDISEDMFVEKMLRRFKGVGHMSLLTQSGVEQKAYENATLWQKWTRYSGKTITQGLTYLVDTAGQHGLSWVKSIIPTRQVYALLIFYIYGFLTSAILLWILPLMVFYIALITMLTATLQMFYAKQKLKDVKTVVSLLRKFNSTLDNDTAASQFTWNSMTPYWMFFVSLGALIMALTTSDRNLIPCSELSLLSAFLTAVCIAALSDRFDRLTCLAIALEVLSTVPAILETLPHVRFLTPLATAFAGIWFSLPVAPNLYLQFGFPVLAWMVVPLLFLRMARQMSWQGTYRVLVPHLVCLFWWQLAVVFFRYSTWLGLIRASVGWILFLILLPVLVVLLIVYTFYFLSSLLTLTNLMRVVTTVFLLAVPTALIFWGKTGFKVRGFSLQGKSAKSKVVLVALFALSVIPFVFVNQGTEKDTAGHYVTWEQYKKFCSQPRWDETNMAESMIMCSHFTHLMAEWSGKVKKIVVKNLDNQAEAFINLFPWSISEWLRCTYGIEYPECELLADPLKKELCEISTLQNRKCSLQNLNRYTFEIWVQMPIDRDLVHDVRVEASQYFQEVLMKIQAGDTIKFRALLQSQLGNVWPQLKLYYVECESCGGEEPVAYGTKGLLQESLSLWDLIVNAVQQTWNFFLAPVLEFHVK